MVEINATEQNIEKRVKRNEDSLRDLWGTLNIPSFTYRGPRRRRQKGPEKTFEEIIAENFLNMAKEIVNQVQEAQSPRKDKPKEEHTKTDSNQTDKN